MLFRDWTLLSGFAAILVSALVMNLVFGKFNPGFDGQPIAHTDGLWNFLGMALVGFGSVLLGGCPLRQLIMAGEGNSDSAITVLGFIAGAAFAHNFGLASSVEGATTGGKAAVVIGLLVCAIIAVYCTFFKGGLKSENRRQGAVMSGAGNSAAPGTGK
jgi:YedE family putative selenium metabolism protein